jgi:hypothetical protein
VQQFRSEGVFALLVQGRRLLRIQFGQALVDQARRTREAFQHRQVVGILARQLLQLGVVLGVHRGELVEQRAHRRVGAGDGEQQQVQSVRESGGVQFHLGKGVGYIVLGLAHPRSRLGFAEN